MGSFYYVCNRISGFSYENKGRISVYLNEKIMLEEKAGVIAGQIWQALNENGTQTTKALKKATKLKTEKDLFLGLGWLLREDKIETSEAEGELSVKLK